MDINYGKECFSAEAISKQHVMDWADKRALDVMIDANDDADKRSKSMLLTLPFPMSR